MNRFGSPSEEHQPVTYWGGHPIYAAHLIVIGFVAAMVGLVVCQFSGGLGWVSAWLPFDNMRVGRGEVWRLATYGVLNAPDIWFALDMVMIVWFGREVEKVLGRRQFLGLCAVVYLVAPLVLTALAPVRPAGLAGNQGFSLALFVAFATYFPGAVMIFNLLAKWVALIFVAIYSLRALGNRDWVSLLSLWTTSGSAYAFIRYQQGRWSLPRLRWPRRRPKLRVLPDLPPAPRSRRDAAKAEIDALLDKIAQSGLQSLTAKERAQLEQRRRDLRG